jgi:glycosyltransferase involved in cell wall biosynthesis
MKGNHLRIFHEYGDPRHFSALFFLKERKDIISNIEQIVFDPKILVYKTLPQKLDFSYMVKNIASLFRSMLSYDKDAINIVGMAPLHYFVYYFQKLNLKDPTVYFTSWPYWDFGKRYGCWVREYPLDLRKPWMDFLKNVNAIVCVTKASYQALKRYSKKCFWIPHSVDTTLFKPRHKPKEHDLIGVLFVGRLVEEKGVLELIDVAKKIKACQKNVEFWFVGQGPLRSYLDKLKKQLPIRYLGHIDNTLLPKVYQEADILVLPSKRKRRWEELFGIVLIEAMSCGLPIIASNHVGPREIITHGHDGFLIRNDPNLDRTKFIEEIAKYICLLAENMDLRREMGLRGRRKAEQLYDVKVVAERWREILETVMTKNK